MVYTNLYIVFEKIKKERIPLEYFNKSFDQPVQNLL